MERDDLGFAAYAQRCLMIRTKAGTVEPFGLNTAQQYLHERLEAQLQETGRVRALILKGRQQGCSTYVAGRFFSNVMQHTGTRAFILAHQEDASQAIFEIAQRFYDQYPEAERPEVAKQNARVLRFKALDSGYEVGTAGSRGVGRGKTLQYFHGSEVAYWPHAETHLSGALQAVPNVEGTECILESTSDGPHGVFHAMCLAAQAGLNDYQLIFIPWFWQAEYRMEVELTLTEEERAYAERFELDLAQMALRRRKIAELGGPAEFRREYPSDVEEAFTADARGALWERETLRKTRVGTPPPLRRVVVGVDPATTSGKDSDETGIVVVGLGTDGHGYVLADGTLSGPPLAWASAAVAAYHAHRADLLVAEANNGGELVEYTLRTIDPRLPVKLVSASRGKQARAHPLAALYAQGRIHHVGTLPALEDQLCTWVPGAAWSPDRLDALVWALTHLFDLCPGERLPKVATAPVAVF